MMNARKGMMWLCGGFAPLVAFMLIVAQARTAGAVPMTFDLTGVGFSGLKADVVFGYTPGTGTIAIDISNTSLSSAGPNPRLTGFAFNSPSNVTGFSRFSGPSGWDGSFALDHINTPGQFGKFDIVGRTGKNFNGGYPNNGIPVGSTFHFEFVLAGSQLNTLNESSFLSLLSYDLLGKHDEDKHEKVEHEDEDEQYFIARFQRAGAYGKGSDVAIPDGSPVPVPVPEPATLFLLGSGLAGLGFIGRKRLTTEKKG